MFYSFGNICEKEVIDIETGERLGFIDDIEVDIGKSTAKGMIIHGRQRFFGLLGKEEDIVILCSEIKVIGEEIILIKRQKT